MQINQDVHMIEIDQQGKKFDKQNEYLMTWRLGMTMQKVAPL